MHAASRATAAPAQRSRSSTQGSAEGPPRAGGEPRILYWYRTPPGVKVGREAFDLATRRTLEAQYPVIAFDWRKIAETPFPPPDAEYWRERRRAEKAAKQARRGAKEEEDEAGEEAARDEQPPPGEETEALEADDDNVEESEAVAGPEASSFEADSIVDSSVEGLGDAARERELPGPAPDAVGEAPLEIRPHEPAAARPAGSRRSRRRRRGRRGHSGGGQTPAGSGSVG